MSVSDHVDLEPFMAGVEKRNPHELEFIQAVREENHSDTDCISQIASKSCLTY